MGSSRKQAAEPRNEVRLCGRLSGRVEVRTLPSGDDVAVWRLVVTRTGVRVGGVDTIDCESYAPRVIRTAARWPDGEIVAVDGSLRRRFWQTPGGAQSRYSVDVSAARRARSMEEPDARATTVRAP